MKTQLGRHVFGSAVILFGILFLYWHNSAIELQVQPFRSVPHPEILAGLVGAIELVGGLAIQWRKTARIGSLALGGVFLLFSLLCIPGIVMHPGVYVFYGNFFEQFSQFSGALIVFAALGAGDSEWVALAARLGYFFFGVCVISFTLAQIVYPSLTAPLVPKWIPPGQMFWAIATTIAFGLAAVALLSGRLALLASRLLTAMLLGFGLLVWVPALFANSHSLTNWTESAETFVIAGAAWIVADYLGQRGSTATAG
jgi:hypothetical protein